MNTVSCHRKYPITTNFLDTMLEHSVDIQDGETKLDAYRRGLKELDQIAAELRKDANPHLYQESKVDSGIDLLEHMQRSSPPAPIPEINLKDIRLQEEIEDRILAAESPDELQSIKAKYVVFPVKTLTLYNKRMQEFTSGRPLDFTEGLE